MIHATDNRQFRSETPLDKVKWEYTWQPRKGRQTNGKYFEYFQVTIVNNDPKIKKCSLYILFGQKYTQVTSTNRIDFFSEIINIHPSDCDFIHLGPIYFNGCIELVLWRYYTYFGFNRATDERGEGFSKQTENVSLTVFVTEFRCCMLPKYTCALQPAFSGLVQWPKLSTPGSHNQLPIQDKKR